MMTMTMPTTPPPSPVSRWCDDERSVLCPLPWTSVGRDEDGGGDTQNPFSLHDFFLACKTLRDDEYHDWTETTETEEDLAEENDEEEGDPQQGDDHTITIGDAEYSEFDKETYCMDRDFMYLGGDEEDEHHNTHAFLPASPTLARLITPAKDEEETPMLPGGGHMRFWYT